MRSFCGKLSVFVAMLVAQVSSRVPLDKRDVNIQIPTPDLSSYFSSAPIMPNAPKMPSMPYAPNTPNRPNAPNMSYAPNMSMPNMTLPSIPNMNYSLPNMNYSLPNMNYSMPNMGGYMNSLYNSLPGMSTMMSSLSAALSYLPSTSVLYNLIMKALDAVTPDYATLVNLYNQLLQHKEEHYQHKMEMMRIKYGDPSYQAPPASGSGYRGVQSANY
uniref:Uncharacterized protein n=2 Tax=Cacopsylla melanoneura TaxID=428564 RepID=A0A8D8W1C2_9HEMI